MQTSPAIGTPGSGVHPPSARVFSGALLGSGAVIVWNDVVTEGRDQFYQWHDKEHIPERLGIRGFRRGRRYICAGHSPEWLTLYEATDLSVLSSREYLDRLNSPTPLTTSTLRYFRNTSRSVCRVVTSLGSSSGGHVLVLRLEVPSEHSASFCERVGGKIFPRVLGLTGVVGCHLYAADAEASYTDTAESKTRTFDVPGWVLLVECTRADIAGRAREIIDAGDIEQLEVRIRDGGRAVYSLEICRLASDDDQH